jgi:hypothetical protein
VPRISKHPVDFSPREAAAPEIVLGLRAAGDGAVCGPPEEGPEE